MDTILSLRRELEAVKREADRAIELEIKTSEKLDIAREALERIGKHDVACMDSENGQSFDSCDFMKGIVYEALKQIGGECEL